MGFLEIMHTYINRTGQTKEEVLAMFSYFELHEIEKLIFEANKFNKKLVLYYVDDTARENDKPTYKFE